MIELATSSVRRFARTWLLRVAGLAVVFLFVAAPLPGDSPGCDQPPEFDDSPGLQGDGFVRSLCGERCVKDCNVLVNCRRYSPGQGHSDCVEECTGPDGRNCLAQTFDSLCPIDRYGPGRVVTVKERDQCISDAENAACWCAEGQNCWSQEMPIPLSCTAGSLCDPR